MASEFVRSISDLGVDVSTTNADDLSKLQRLSGPQLLKMVKSFPPSDANIFPQYIFPA